MKINKKTLSLVISFCLILVIGIQLIAAAIEVPLSPYSDYSNSNTDWWQYQFEGYENDPDHAFNKNVNCGPACSAMLINYLRGKGITTTYYASISSAYPEVHCYARWDYCKANGHSNGYDNSDWSSPGATTEQIRSALSSENIQTHTFTGYDCCNDGRGITNLQNAIDQGKVCICLVDPSRYRDTDCHSHWVIAYGYDNNYIYLNDPGYITGEGFPASISDFADALWDVTELSTVIVSDTTIYNYPTVDSFNVTPTSITLGDAFNISYTVSDDIGLQQTELWRVNDVGGEPGDWNTLDNPIFTKVLSGQKNYSGSFTDTPDTAGTYWYGMHVVDTSGNWSVEPKPPGPIVVTVTNPTPTIYVPDDYSTIQAAVDAASSGDTIIVRDGTYDESITFPPGKVIILQSLSGPSSTIIRGDDGSPTATFDSALTGTTLEGFTITHVDGLTGRGIYSCESNLSINNCTISNNNCFEGGAYSSGSGGGICVYLGTLTITGSTISGNSTNNVSGSGGGICVYLGTLTITGSTISGNSAYKVYGDGGGICSDDSLTTITATTISGNYSAYGLAGGIYNTGGTLNITGSTISNNSSGGGGGGIGNWYGTLTITGSTISGNSAEGSVYGVSGGGIYIDSYSGILTIGGDSADEKNTICGNYKSGDSPSLDQQIRGYFSLFPSSLYETYKDTNYISAYCTENNPPTIEITSGPSGTIDYNDITFTWIGSDPDGEVTGYYYGLDDPTPNTWTTETTHTFNNVSEGNHTFYVQAKDDIGATSSVVSRSFAYTPPVSTSDIKVEKVKICKDIQLIGSYNPNNISLNVKFKNIGEVVIDSFQIELYINGERKHVEKVNNKNLAPGSSGNSLFYWTLSEDICGDNIKMEIKITDVNPVESNANTGNNSKIKTISIYYVPFNIKEETYSFENPGFSDWPKLKSTLDELKPLIRGVCFWAWGKINSLNGVCYGMASTVIAYKEGPLTIPYGGSVNDLELTMPEVSNNILVYQNNLSALGIQVHRIVDQIMSNFPCISDEYKDVIDSLKKGKLKMLILGESGTFGAHQLVAYQCITDKATNIAYVYVYDPNCPEDEIILKLPLNLGGTISYIGYDMLWAEDLKPLPAELIEEYFNDLANLIYDGLKSAGQELINVFSSVDTLITDEYGRKIGYLDGSPINEIPDGVMEIFGDFETYQIPLSLNYNIQLKGKEQGIFELHLTKPNPDDTVLNIVYQDVPTENNSEASLTIGPSVTDFTMQLDQDGDGIVDETKDPDFIEGVAVILGDFGSANNGPPDGKVNFEDLMIFALSYGSTSFDSNWNPVCDIAGPGGSLIPDGVIDFEDLMIFAMNYGKTCADL